MGTGSLIALPVCRKDDIHVHRARTPCFLSWALRYTVIVIVVTTINFVWYRLKKYLGAGAIIKLAARP